MQILKFMLIVCGFLPILFCFKLKMTGYFEAGDIVEYRFPTEICGKGAGLGIVLSSTWLRANDKENSPDLRIHPLCSRAGEEGMSGSEIVLVEDEDSSSVNIPVESIVRRLDGVYYSQRPIEDRRLNPHGEHSEDVFLIRMDDINFQNIYLRSPQES